MFLVDCMGMTGPLEDVDAEPFASAVRPVKAHIEKSLGSVSGSFASLKVIFFVDPRRGLGFRLAGPEPVVRKAVELVREDSSCLLFRPN